MNKVRLVAVATKSVKVLQAELRSDRWKYRLRMVDRRMRAEIAGITGEIEIHKVK